MSVGSAIGGAEETVDMVTVLALVGVAIYLFYKFPNFLSSIGADFNTAFSGLVSFPGGGEVAGSAETYTGAAQSVIDDPIGAAEATVGINPVDSIDLPSTTPGLPPGYDPNTGQIGNPIYQTSGPAQ